MWLMYAYVVCLKWRENTEEWCVTAGDVFLWQTRCSALPLRLVINGYRLITTKESTMLPACPTLLVTQSHWLICTFRYRHSLRNCLQHLSNLSSYSVTEKTTTLAEPMFFFICLLSPLVPISSSFPRSLNTEDIFILHGKDKKNPLIYGLFTTSRYVTVKHWTHVRHKHGNTVANLNCSFNLYTHI